MTYAFLAETGFNIHEADISADMYRDIDILESGFGALREGVENMYVDKVSYSYMKSIIIDLLDNVRKHLLEMVQRLLSMINNLYTNSINLLDKYQDILITRMEHLDQPVVHKTFAYPQCKGYPVIIHAGTIDKAVNGLMKAISAGTINPGRVGMEADKLLHDFGLKVTKEVINVNDIVGSVTKATEKHVKGKPRITTVSADTLKEYVATIKHYKEDVAEVRELKKSIEEEYLALRDSHVRATETTSVVMKGSLKYQLAPDKEEFMAAEYSRFADVNTEVLRLFNGYIAIYRTAFDVTLKCLYDRYTDRQDFITKLFTATGMFAAVNTANAVDKIEINTRIDQGKKKKK